MLCRRGDGVQDEALRGPQPVRAVHEDDGKKTFALSMTFTNS